MGYSLDSLHWMQGLLADEPAAISALSTFTRTYHIVAFVLHDPDVDTAFHRVMQRRFGALHRNTGRRVLFFVAGLGDRINKPQMDDVRMVIDRLAQRYSNTGARQQAGNGVPLVAEALGLTGRLPAIVMVDATARDPMRNDWFWMPTDAENVWWHLEALAAYQYAHHEARGRGEGRSPHLQAFLHDARPFAPGDRRGEVASAGQYLAAASGLGAQRLSRLSSALTDDLAAVSRRVGEAAEAAHENPDDPDVQAVQKAAHEFNTRLRALTPARLPDLAFLNADIDHESRVNVVSAWYSKQALDAWAPTLAADAVDLGLSATATPSYTGPVVELGSAVERELVLSAGQALRAYVDIPVPLAYNRVYRPSPVRDFKLPVTGSDGKRKPLDLNRCQHGSDLWLPPGIGVLRAAFRETAGPDGGSLLTWTTELSMERFIEEWEAMSSIRNAAAHANRPITGDDFDCLLEKMNHLKIRGELDWIVSTKRRLLDPGFIKAELWRT